MPKLSLDYGPEVDGQATAHCELDGALEPETNLSIAEEMAALTGNQFNATLEHPDLPNILFVEEQAKRNEAMKR